jgi:AcrR family transcriptional regulator
VVVNSPIAGVPGCSDGGPEELDVGRHANHGERRTAVLTATWRVIARWGIEATTIREIAREADCSVGSLSHYFKNKDDILRCALEMADGHVAERLKTIAAELPPERALREALAQALPLDEERALELTLDVNFWARALNHPPLRATQHLDHDRWRSIVLDLVERCVAAGSFGAAPDAEDIADVLVAFVDGIGLQALVYPELVSAARVEHLLDAQLDALGLRAPAHKKRARPHHGHGGSG